MMTLLGTRPEIIRLSRVMPAMDAAFQHVIVHTGQNSTPALCQVFFDELGLRAPDVALGMTVPDGASAGLAPPRPGAALARLFHGVEEAILRHRPDAMLILGDTNSALACLVARRHGVAVYHMEAGNRCFDRESPEEANRRVIDHSADFNLAYTEAARRNLLREGLPAARIWVTGSPLREVVEHHRPAIAGSRILDALGLRPGAYLLASLHRQENVDLPDRLAGLLEALSRLAAETGWPVMVSTHPRTRDRLAAMAHAASAPRATAAAGPGLLMLDPFGFLDWCRLQRDAACVVSDSGTLPEEAAMLGFRAVIARRAMERPEALETGTVLLAGIEPRSVIEAVRLALAQPPPALAPADYAPPDVSRRVVALMAGTWRLNASWS